MGCSLDQGKCDFLFVKAYDQNECLNMISNMDDLTQDDIVNQTLLIIMSL